MHASVCKCGEGEDAVLQVGVFNSLFQRKDLFSFYW